MYRRGWPYVSGGIVAAEGIYFGIDLILSQQWHNMGHLSAQFPPTGLFHRHLRIGQGLELEPLGSLGVDLEAGM